MGAKGTPVGHRGQRTAAVATAGVLDLIGAATASRYGLVGEPLRIAAPRWVPRRVVLTAFGSALSGPLVVDAALVGLAVATDRGSPSAHRWIGRLGRLRLVGVLAEPVSWGRRRPRWTMAIAAAQVGAAVLLIRSGRPDGTSGR